MGAKKYLSDNEAYICLSKSNIATLDGISRVTAMPVDMIVSEALKIYVKIINVKEGLDG